MPTIAFPADLLDRRGPSTITWGLQGATLTHASPLSGAVRTLATPGARWRFTATWPALSPFLSAKAVEVQNNAFSDRALVETFLASLGGRSGRFTFYPPESLSTGSMRGRAAASIAQASVNGAGQSGTSLQCVATYFNVATYGQFFSVNGELKQITAATATDVGGNITLNFAPPLRSSPPNGAAVSFVKPLGTFMLVDDYAGLTVGPGGYADFTLDAIEAFL